MSDIGKTTNGDIYCHTETLKEKSEGAYRIAKERVRQIEEENWTPTHDDTHTKGELVWAAVTFAVPSKVKICSKAVAAALHGFTGDRHTWPATWGFVWNKRCEKTSRIRLLEMAGALIAAEIDRLLRKKARKKLKMKKVEDLY